MRIYMLSLRNNVMLFCWKCFPNHDLILLDNTLTEILLEPILDLILSLVHF